MPHPRLRLVFRAGQAARARRAGHISRTLAAAVLLGATALAAGGCGKAADAVALPTVTGVFGSDPLISLPGSKPPATLEVKTVRQGTGPVVTPDDYVLFNVEAKVWAGDRLVLDSFTDRTPQGLPLASGLPAWRRLAGHRVGSRVLMVVPPKDGFGPQGNPSVNVTGRDTLVFVFDIIQAFSPSTRADGAVVPYKPGPDMPTVTTTAQGQPQVTIPRHSNPPTQLVSKVLLQGQGPQALKGDTVVVQFTGLVWRTGKVFDSTWTNKAPQVFKIAKGQTIKGWQEGLTGKRVGSRVLLVIPPNLGYGKGGKAPVIGPTDTLVYVVDIISAVQP